MAPYGEVASPHRTFEEPLIMSPIAAYFLFVARENERQLELERQPFRASGPSVIARVRSAVTGLRFGSGIASRASRSGDSAA